MKTAEQYQQLSISEFTKAAKNYENDKTDIYKMCRKDYPPILEEIKKNPFETLLDAGCGTAPMISLLTEEYPDPQAFINEVARVLRPGGILVLRDNTGSKGMMWFVNHIELPLANLMGHGDVAARTIDEVRGYCKAAGLTIEKIEQQKGFRMHLVARKGQ